MCNVHPNTPASITEMAPLVALTAEKRFLAGLVLRFRLEKDRCFLDLLGRPLFLGICSLSALWCLCANKIMTSF